MTTECCFLLIEDDPFHAAVIAAKLKAEYPAAKVVLYVTEGSFLKDFASNATPYFDLAIIDQMIPYTTIEDEELPEDAAKLNAFRGGTRCYEALRHNASTQELPVVFYTILDEQTVPPRTTYVAKSGDPELTCLLAEVKRLLDAAPPRRAEAAPSAATPPRRGNVLAFPADNE